MHNRPVRRRSCWTKCLLLIPAAWFVFVVVFLAQEHVNNLARQNAEEAAYETHRQRHHPRHLGVDNPSALAGPTEGGQLNVIQGFGPPMQLEGDESLGGGHGGGGGQDPEVYGIKTGAFGGPPAAKPGEPEEPPEADEAAKGSRQKQPKKKPKKPKAVATDELETAPFSINMSDPIYRKGDANQAGEGGRPVKIDNHALSPEQAAQVKTGWKNHEFNEVVSNMISLHRSLPVTIDSDCLKEPYDIPTLPDTSIVICFHNEAWSTLLRTVHSAYERSPAGLIREVILVDDASTHEYLREPLETYMKEHFPSVSIVRAPNREGLIRARLRGAIVAKAKTITFLDSHCECTEGWLPPLLARIRADPKTVVCPVIDVIDDNTFEYFYASATATNVGGFDWSLQFNWHQIPPRDRIGRRDIDPVRTPTMAGGLFTIDKGFFELLGSYDPGFDIWGGENLEISFKTWMCGGRLEIIPCSHVGHIFRKHSPYKWRTGVNVLKRNSVRLAEVWLDEFKQYYYERINWDIGEYGDVSERKQLREKLQCKSFRWYLENVYPELYVPGDAVATGEIRNKALINNEAYCMDASVDEPDEAKPVSVYVCHGQGENQVRNEGGGSKICLDWGYQKKTARASRYPELYWCHGLGGNQHWMLTSMGEIRRDDSCMDFSGTKVEMIACHGLKGNQQWLYNHQTGLLLHVYSNTCAEMTKDGARLEMTDCDTNNLYQRWRFKNYNATKAARQSLVENNLQQPPGLIKQGFR